MTALRERDALLGASLSWDGGAGVGDGIEPDGGLRVRTADGGVTVLSAGEVRLSR